MLRLFLKYYEMPRDSRIEEDIWCITAYRHCDHIYSMYTLIDKNYYDLFYSIARETIAIRFLDDYVVISSNRVSYYISRLGELL